MSVLSAKYRLEIAKAEQREAGEMLKSISLQVMKMWEKKNFQSVEGHGMDWQLWKFVGSFSLLEGNDSYKVFTTLERTELTRKIQDSSFETTGSLFGLMSFEILRDSKTKALKQRLNFQMEQEKYDAGLISVVDYLRFRKKNSCEKLSQLLSNRIGVLLCI